MPTYSTNMLTYVEKLDLYVVNQTNKQKQHK